MKCNFIGSFNKINNHRDCDYNRQFGLECEFNDDIYNKVAVEIQNILGNKATYSVQDAYRYFHRTFYAYPIDYRSYYNYCNTECALPGFIYGNPTISDDSDIERLAEESGTFYSYLKNGRFTDEQTLTLVIDTHNDCLRKKYAYLEILHKKQESDLLNVYGEFEKNDNVYYGINGQERTVIGEIGENIILVIGSFDGKSINSMKILLGEELLKEVEYALEFFRRHS